MLKPETHFNVVVFDVETTGLYPHRGDRIIEVGAIRLVHGEPAETFHSLVRTGKRISTAAVRVHGITPAMLEDQPGPDKVMPRFQVFIGQSLLVAHNAAFDIEFLRHEFHRLGLGFSNSYKCTLQLSRRLCPGLPDYSLATVYRHLCGEIPPDIQPHRALDDARLTAGIWVATSSIKQIKSKEVTQ